MFCNDWFVVMTKPRMENQACVHLERQGFEVYLPFWKSLKKQRGSWQQVQAPMFPRYLFVRQNGPEHSIAPIRSTYGVSQLVRFGSEPARASEELVNEIRKMQQDREQTQQTIKPFKKGDKVLVTDGPFRGVSAEVLSSDMQRVILLLQVLGSKQQIEFDINACRAS